MSVVSSSLRSSHAHPLSSILGHQRAVGSLQLAFEHQRLHHAYLLHGPEGVGKRLTALCFAQVLLCSKVERVSGAPQSACGQCKSCVRLEKYRAGDDHAFHPDLHVIAREQDASGKRAKEIKIQPIRDLQKALSFGAFEGGRRVIVIEEVERLGLSAANALLKTLEEPLPSVHFLLTSTSLNSVLPTIRSRAQGVRFGPLSSEVMVYLIEEEERRIEMIKNQESPDGNDRFGELHPLTPTQRQSLAQLSGGSIGRAVALYHQGGLTRAETLISQADRLGGPQDIVAALSTVPSLAELSAKELELWLHLMRCWYRDALISMHSAHGVPLFFPGQSALTLKRGQQLGMQRLLWRLEALDRAEWHLLKRTGSNRKLILEALLLYLAGFDTVTQAPLTLS